MGPHLVRQGCTPSPCFHPPAAQVCGLLSLECGSWLGGDVPILPQGQRPFCTQQQSLVLLKGMPYPARASPLPPHPHLREGVQFCLHDHSHLETFHHWPSHVNPPCFHCQFPQADVCREECEVTPSGLKWKKKDQQCNAH